MSLNLGSRLNPLNYLPFGSKFHSVARSALFSIICTLIATVSLVKLFGETAKQVILSDLQIIAEKSNPNLDSNSVLVRMNQLSSHPFVDCVRLTRLDREVLVSGPNCNTHSFLGSYFLGRIEMEVPNSNLKTYVVGRLPNSLLALLIFFSIFFAISLYFLGYLATFFKTQEVRKKFERAQEFQIFAQKIGHDIRSPVAALKTCLLTIKQEISPEIYNIAQIASDRLSKIAGSLLSGISDPSALEESKQPKLELLDPTEPAKEILQELKAVNKEAIECEIVFDPAEIFKIKADPLGLRRIFSNLFQNSFEARSPNSSVKLKVNFYSSKTNSLIIEISDNGLGFPKEILKLQGREIRTLGKFSGNGLGIFSSRSLIESWGGRMELSNLPSPQRGALIRLSFPKP